MLLSSLFCVILKISLDNMRLMKSDEMFLARDFDWDSYYTEVKDGGTITVYRPMPLQSTEDPVEVSVDIVNMSNGQFLASTSITLDLVD